MDDGVVYRTSETASLGWLAYVVLLVVGWMTCVAVVPSAWLPASIFALVSAVTALALVLRPEATILEVSDERLVVVTGGRREEYPFVSITAATCSWVPYSGTTLRLDWRDGRSVEIPVSRSTRDLRAALRRSLGLCRPPAISGNFASRQALSRARMDWVAR